MTKAQLTRLQRNLRIGRWLPRDPVFRAGFAAAVHKLEQLYDDGPIVVRYHCGGQYFTDDPRRFSAAYYSPENVSATALAEACEVSR